MMTVRFLFLCFALAIAWTPRLCIGSVPLKLKKQVLENVHFEQLNQSGKLTYSLKCLSFTQEQNNKICDLENPTLHVHTESGRYLLHAEKGKFSHETNHPELIELYDNITIDIYKDGHHFTLITEHIEYYPSDQVVLITEPVHLTSLNMDIDAQEARLELNSGLVTFSGDVNTQYDSEKGKQS